MPRPKSIENAAGAEATARWRARKRAARRPEVDAVDAALAAALAVYRHVAVARHRDRDVERVTALEALAVQHLTSLRNPDGSARYDRDQAFRAVLRRVRRDDAGSLVSVTTRSAEVRIPPITP